MKKIIPILLAAVIFTGVFAGCAEPVDSDSGLSIVTTIFPEYDWVKQIMGEQAENADITMLLDSGIDFPSRWYKPPPLGGKCFQHSSLKAHTGKQQHLEMERKETTNL